MWLRYPVCLVFSFPYSTPCILLTGMLRGLALTRPQAPNPRPLGVGCRGGEGAYAHPLGAGLWSYLSLARDGRSPSQWLAGG